uniref:Uncharacterized protein n=1 Tax=Anguilla anguilla TaxID=7936 RepID=A0A0E9XF63_ANGAN
MRCYQLTSSVQGSVFATVSVPASTRKYAERIHSLDDVSSKLIP